MIKVKGFVSEIALRMKDEVCVCVCVLVILQREMAA